MSREDILKKIMKNKPDLLNLPLINIEEFKSNTNMYTAFISSVEETGGKIFQVKNKSKIEEIILEKFDKDKYILSFIKGIKIKNNYPDAATRENLFKLDAACIEGQFGVAENGAVWISDINYSHRSIPFIASHLVILLNSINIVPTMHEALERLSGFNEGYGVFISGPSKTADIEQSLVIGAQGPLSLTVYLYDSV